MGDRGDVLLRSAKLRIPVPRKGYVVRERLFALLDDSSKVSVTYVRGGAGTGKTMLLSTFIKERALPNVAWMSLDAYDDDSYTFWLYAVAALTPTLGDGGDLLSIMRSRPDRTREEELIAAGIGLVSDGRKRYLVLDDVQNLSDPELLDEVERFLAVIPADLHVIMLSREEPPIYLGPLAMSGRLLLIGEDEMRLSDEEGLSFLTRTLGVDDDQTARELNAYAGGWIGGLQLAVAASPRCRDAALLFRSGNGIAEEYLTREVFEALDPAEREFLLGTCILPCFDADLCERLFEGFSHAHFDMMIETLSAKNLFLVCVDEAGGLYRYHDILSDYLLRCLAKLPVGREREMRRHAARAFADRGDFAEAMRQTNACADWGETLRYAHECDGTAEVWNLLGHVPTEVLSDDTELSVQCLMFDYCAMHTEHARGLFRQLHEKHHDDALYQVIAFMEPLFMATGASTLPRYRRFTAEQFDALGLEGVARALALIESGTAYAAHEEWREAERQFDEAVRLSSGVNDMVTLLAQMGLAQLYESVGRLRDALACGATCADLFARYGHKRLSGEWFSYEIGAAGVHMRQMRLDDAQLLIDGLDELVEEDADGPLVFIRTLMRLTLEVHHVEMLLLRGQTEAGLAAVRELMLKNPKMPLISCPRIIYELLCAGRLSEDIAKKVLSEDAGSIGEEQLSSDVRLVKARVLFDHAPAGEEGAGRRVVGIHETEALLSAARESGNGRMLIEAALQRIHMEGEPTAATMRMMSDLLREAVAYAAPEGMLMPFHLERHDVEPLLRRLIDRGREESLSPGEYAFVRDALVSSAGAVLPDTPSSEAEALTEREIEILRELALGITNREIAERLFISRATVKTHLSSIFSKLEVSSRTMAVERAHDLGII